MEWTNEWIYEWMNKSEVVGLLFGKKQLVPFPFISTKVTEISLSSQKLALARSWIFIYAT